MHTIARFVQRFNATCPWNQLKPSLGRRVAHWLEDTRGEQVCDGIAGDLKMRLDLSIYLERWVLLNMYEIALRNTIWRVLRPGDRFVDAGANIGLFTLLGARRVGPTGHVYSFEPNPAVAKRLRANLELNDFDNVTISPAGVWSERGRSDLFEFDGGLAAESSLRSQAGRSATAVSQVDLVPLDEVVDPPVRLLKLDVEGAELAALSGARSLLTTEPKPHVIFEVNPNTCRAFGYEPIELLDYVLGCRAGDRIHIIKTRRCVRTSRSQLIEDIRHRPQKLRNIWLEPVA